MFMHIVKSWTKVPYHLNKARKWSQTCRWVSSRVELIKDASNSNLHKKIPYAEFFSCRQIISDNKINKPLVIMKANTGHLLLRKSVCSFCFIFQSQCLLMKVDSASPMPHFNALKMTSVQLASWPTRLEDFAKTDTSAAAKPSALQMFHCTLLLQRCSQKVTYWQQVRRAWHTIVPWCVKCMAQLYYYKSV